MNVDVALNNDGNNLHNTSTLEQSTNKTALRQYTHTDKSKSKQHT